MNANEVYLTNIHNMTDKELVTALNEQYEYVGQLETDMGELNGNSRESTMEAVTRAYKAAKEYEGWLEQEWNERDAR